MRKLSLPNLSGLPNFSRTSLGISDLSRTVRKDFWNSIFSESRAHTLWLDCCLPLLQAINSMDLFELWYNWPAGDCPQGYPEIAKSLGWIKGGREEPFSNGHLQAILERLTALNKEAI